MLPVLGLLLALALGGRQAWAPRPGPDGRRGSPPPWPSPPPFSRVASSAATTGLGDWAPPLGVTLKADGLSAVLLVSARLVLLAVGLHAQRDFQVPAGSPETRTSLTFWMLLFGVWAGLNIVVLAQDLFTLFVALELLTFSAVPLVSLDGRAETLAAALRYLLFALLGSVLYLLGAVLFYGT